MAAVVQPARAGLGAEQQIADPLVQLGRHQPGALGGLEPDLVGPVEHRGGTRSRTASRRMRFGRLPSFRNAAGRPYANSAIRRSSSGSRTSRLWAMLLRSA